MTRAGAVVAVLAVLALLVGRALGWLEFVAFGSAGLFAVLVAIPFVVGRLTFDVERAATEDRVEVGATVSSTVRLKRRHAFGLFGATTSVSDQVRCQRADHDAVQRFPIATRAATVTHDTPLPTGVRGLLTVGPIEVSKADPFGFFRRAATEGETYQMWVHPRVAPIAATPVGFARDLEGPTTDSSPAGDVAFHTIREYQFGDDHRHIHWMSSARSGSLMVRHYVDNRRAHLLVQLDADADVFEPDAYELAVEVAATLAVNGLRRGETTSLANGNDVLLTAAAPKPVSKLLEDLTMIEPASGVGPLDDALTASLQAEPSASAVVIITGDRPTSSSLSLNDRLEGRSLVVIRCRVASSAAPRTLPGATLIDVDSLRRFQVAWNRAVT